MKNILWLAIAIVVIVGGTWYFHNQGASSPVVKIGAILPLTGNNATHGEYSKRGTELGLSQLDQKNIEILYEDSQLDAKVAVSAYDKLVKVDGVKAILALGSSVGMVLAPLANQDHIPLLGIVAAPAYSTPNDYTFRITGSAVDEANYAVNEVANVLGKKKVAIFFENNDYGKGTEGAFKKSFTRKGTIVAEESFLPSDTDFRSQLTKIKNLNPEVVYIPAEGKQTGLVLKQAQELGLTTTFMCAQACENPDLITTAGAAAEGLLLTAPTSDANPTLAALYQSKYNQQINFVSMRMYDGTRLLSYAVDKCATAVTGECLLSVLSTIKDFPGSSYPITFNQNGDINERFVVKTVQNGQFVEVK